MKGKILVSVMLPVTGRIYDLWVPKDMLIRDAAELIIGILESRERYRFKATAQNALFSAETGDLLDPCSTIGAAGLVCGSRLAIA